MDENEWELKNVEEKKALPPERSIRKNFLSSVFVVKSTRCNYNILLGVFSFLVLVYLVYLVFYNILLGVFV